MMGLEKLVREAKGEGTSALINGDALTGIFTSESHEGKVFFTTAHGDFWYVQGEEAYQVSHDKKRGLRGGSLPQESSPFVQGEGYDVSRVLKDLGIISQALERRSFLGDETSRFSKQLVRMAAEKDPLKVHDDVLEEAISSYVPTEGSVAPLGRGTGKRVLFKKMDDEGKNLVVWHRDLRPFDAYAIAAVAARLRGRRAPRPRTVSEERFSHDVLMMEKDHFLHAAGALLSGYVVGRRVVVDSSVRSYLQEHGLFNGLASEEQMYDVKRSQKRWQFSLHDDRELILDVQRGTPSYEYVRVARPAPKRRLRGLYEGVKDKASMVVDHLRRHKLAYGLAGLMLVSNSSSYFTGRHLGRDGAGAGQEEVVAAAGRHESPPEKDGHASLPLVKASTYVVRPGDCLWDIAKSAGTEKDDAAVLARTDGLARLNGKLTIGEYVAREKKGERVSRAQDPHLIFPGDTLRMPSYDAPAKDTTVAKASVVSSGDTSVAGSGAAGAAFAAPAVISPFIKSESSIDEVVVEGPSASGRLALPEGGDRSLYLPALRQSVERKDVMALPRSAPTDYVGVLQDLVRLRNRGFSLGELREQYHGFRSDEEVRAALRDYQGMVQSGLILPEEDGVLRYDRDVASESFNRRLVHEYAHGQKSLRELSLSLSEEYGMRVSSSTISKYARAELGVGSRREARPTGSS